jgi:hypothetical protein
MLKLYTDESPGLKVDPFVVMVLSIGFIISVVALHSEFPFISFGGLGRLYGGQGIGVNVIRRGH